jgi:hypothetical protein
MRTRSTVYSCLFVTLSILGLSLAIPMPAYALTVNCVNADSLKYPYNLIDRCAVSTVDRGTAFVAEMTGGESYCDPYHHTSHSQRVRVVGDYQAGGKLLIRSIDIRYLSGTEPWAFYNVNIMDGNGTYFFRDWNNYGRLITWDGASKDIDNTVHIVPNYGFAPVFGSRRYVDVHVHPHFFKYGNAVGTSQVCDGEEVVARFTAP